MKTFDLGIDIENIDHLFFNFFPGRDLHAARGVDNKNNIVAVGGYAADQLILLLEFWPQQALHLLGQYLQHQLQLFFFPGLGLGQLAGLLGDTGQLGFESARCARSVLTAAVCGT